ncbi:MAG: hypothetical protein ACW97P_12040 [Candidatus Hodarchaeales archaeon]|jgi:hypothetical protein
MSQNFTDDQYDIDNEVDTDMENAEVNFAALKSAFSGANAPSSPIDGMRWLDTSKKLIKRSYNSQWYGMLWGDSNFKIPVYKNDQMEGFLIDDTIEDCVIAIKGGTEVYNVNGGNIAGIWQQPSHTLTIGEMSSHSHSGGVTSNDGKHKHDFSGTTPRYGHGVITEGNPGVYGDHLLGSFLQNADLGVANSSKHSHDFTTDPKGGANPTHDHGITYRLRAAICTLQYPDLT